MNTIETHVLEMIGESTSSPDVFADTDAGMAPIRDSVNDAIEEIAMVTGSYEEKYTLPLVANVNFYRLDFSSYRARFGWVTGVWYQDNTRRLEQTDIIRLNKENPRWLMNSGSPEAYFPIGFNHLGIWPRPSSSTGILLIEAVTIPVRYTADTDRIKLRNKFEWAAAHYAVGEYWASRGDARTAVRHHEKYLKRLGIQARYPMSAEMTMRFQSQKEPWPKVTE